MIIDSDPGRPRRPWWPLYTILAEAEWSQKWWLTVTIRGPFKDPFKGPCNVLVRGSPPWRSGPAVYLGSSRDLPPIRRFWEMDEIPTMCDPTNALRRWT